MLHKYRDQSPLASYVAIRTGAAQYGDFWLALGIWTIIMVTQGGYWPMALRSHLPYLNQAAI